MAPLSVRLGWMGIGLTALAAGALGHAQPAATPASAPVAAPAVVAAPATPPAAAGAAGQPAGAGKVALAASKPTAKTAPKAIEKPYWHQLSAPQQEALMPLASEWDKFEGLNKKKWLEIANRFASMKPDEQQRVHERMREWIKLTPSQRTMVRENYARAKKIEPGRKSEQWELYQQLPEDQKKKLADEAALKKKQLALPPSVVQKDRKPLAPIKASVVAPPGSVHLAPTPGAPAMANGVAPTTAPAQVPNPATASTPGTAHPGDAR